MHHDTIITAITQDTGTRCRVKSFHLSISDRFARRRLRLSLAFHRLYDTRICLKNVFWPNLCVGRLFQILEIPVYSSGLNLASALILNQNPILEMASS